MQNGRLLPDGVQAVSVVLENGHHCPAPVTHNLFLPDFTYGHPLPSRLIWHRAGHVHNQIAGISPRIAEMSCSQGPANGWMH